MKTKIVALLVFTTVLYTASVSQATSEIRFREAEDGVLTTPGPPLINQGRPVPSLLLSSDPLTNPGDFPDDQPPGTDDDGTGTTLASGGLYYWTDDDQSGGNSNNNPPSQRNDEGHGRLTFSFDNLEAGTYRIFARVNTAFSDSWWVRFVEKGDDPEGTTGGVVPSSVNRGDNWTKWDISGNGGGSNNPARPPVQLIEGGNGQGSWFWDRIRNDDSGDTEVFWTITAGDYEFWIEHREDGVGLDAIAITNDLDLSRDDMPSFRNDDPPVFRIITVPDRSPRASHIFPADGQEGVLPKGLVLSWEDTRDDPNIDDYVYNVYVSKDPNCGPPDIGTGDGFAQIVFGADVNSTEVPGELDLASTYYLQIDTIDPNLPAGGEIVLASVCITFQTHPLEPFVQSDPDNVLAFVGGSGTFTAVVTISAGNALVYTWFKGTPPGGIAVVAGGHISIVSDEFSTNLTFDPTELADEGEYYVESTNNKGTILSNSALMVIARERAHWPFDDLGGSDPNVSVQDVVGGHTSAIVVGTNEPTFETSQTGLGEAICFTGDDITLVTSNLVPYQRAGTISHWLKPNVLKFMIPVHASLGATNGHGGGDTIEINTEIHNAAGRLAITYQDGDEDTQDQNVDGSANEAGGTAVVGEWIKMTATWDTSDVISLYINGEFVRSNNMADEDFADQIIDMFSIGGPTATTGSGIDRQWDGCIDQVRVYNYPLNAVQVATLYYNDIGVPACLSPVTLDTNDDCLQGLDDLRLWAESFLECQRMPDCIPTVPVL